MGDRLGRVVAQTADRAVAVALGARLVADWADHLDSGVADTADRHSVALGAHLGFAAVDTAGRRSVVLDVARDHLGGDCRHLGLDQQGGDHRDHAV